MILSDNVNKRMHSGSFIRKMFEEGNALKKKFGEDNVFDLSIGNPTFEPPDEFHSRILQLIGKPSAGMHRYMENAGYAETRAAVASQLSTETGLKFSETDIVMTCGSAAAINVVMKSILNPGDEVILFAPFFSEFDNYIDNHGGKVIIVPTDKDFLPQLDKLESAINQKTKAILMNSPNNPTGVVYDHDFMVKISDLLNKKAMQLSRPVILINDEAYRKLIYDNIQFPHIFKYYQHTISVNSHSKDLALPGERIGHIAINPECYAHHELVSGFIFCNRILGFVNAPALMQNVVKHLQDVTISIEAYQKKRDFLYSNLVKMGYQVIKPQGAFYMFPSSPIEDDISFVSVLHNWNILTVPGTGFGSPGYFRIAYCVEDKTLEGSLPGFEKAAKKYNLR
jgi:aspartate aminotransferase